MTPRRFILGFATSRYLRRLYPSFSHRPAYNMTSHGIARSSTTPRSAKAREADLLKIKEYNTLVSEVQDLKSSNTYTQATLSKTSLLLSQNPEFNTIWNYRRRIILHLLSSIPSPTPANPPQDTTESTEEDEKRVEKEKSSLISSELQYLLPLLQSYPKCYWIWNYRIFLLQTASAQLSHPTALKVWKAEMGLVNKMLSRDARNFHGWGYRRFVVSNVEKLLTTSTDTTPVDESTKTVSGVSKSMKEEEEEGLSMVESEFAYTSEMYKKSLSNFSAWHNRSKLIPRLLNERNATMEERRTFLDGELATMQEAIFTDPYDQSIHLYNLHLITSTCSPLESVRVSDIVDLIPPQKFMILLETTKWMKELLEEEPECRLLLESLISVGQLMLGVLAEGGLDVDGGEIRQDLREWLDKLMEVDPMRMGRWKELAGTLE
ncbi:Rab geranylgeranyltransferase [Orbilia ellipsospora]|uniref:Geranylgeranyl transferase type-2 subunit alpha n=1 Tax=Orbilia ellipsospora TaxID=2528407 RepID=A0AAV9XAL3_9PEZI